MLQCCSERVQILYSFPFLLTLQFEFTAVYGGKNDALLRLYAFPWSTIDKIQRRGFEFIWNIVMVQIKITRMT
jgi:hypothetical protein